MRFHVFGTQASIHKLAALWWVTVGATFLLPLAAHSTKPNAWHLMLCSVAALAGIIALVPLALRWPLFRRWFCWTDVLSERERRLLTARGISGFYREAYAQRYLWRVKPYLTRIFAAEFVLCVLEWLVPTGCEVMKVAANVAGFYPIGVCLFILMTFPLGEYHRHGRKGIR